MSQNHLSKKWLFKKIKECSSGIKYCQKKYPKQRIHRKCDAREMDAFEAGCKVDVQNSDCTSNGQG